MHSSLSAQYGNCIVHARRDLAGITRIKGNVLDSRQVPRTSAFQARMAKEAEDNACFLAWTTSNPTCLPWLPGKKEHDQVERHPHLRPAPLQAALAQLRRVNLRSAPHWGSQIRPSIVHQSHPREQSSPRRSGGLALAVEPSRACFPPAAQNSGTMMRAPPIFPLFTPVEFVTVQTQ